MVENLVVAAIVVAAFAYSAWKVLPYALRKRSADAVARACRWAGWSGPAAARAAERIAMNPGCSGCDSCGGCAAARSGATFDGTRSGGGSSEPPP